ncbi:hypothetical protein [Streptomyces sp. NRRL S-455]|uniref:hypothetical protein n=1 Tax=Streptomyces sp. NRRL S-455 TaxID=1463908 RepID=UPI000A9D0C4E|nr:hypothetical protein [Streptomyces sp. NRRL S-455]
MATVRGRRRGTAVSRFGAGIRRGVMAADQFTQVANVLFRDSQLSFKAKGIFGYISTHANGWQVAIADLVRLGPDGREAVRTGLKELEAHGYLIRERLRRPDPTLGEIFYCITGRPATLDIALIEADPVIAAPDAGHADGFGAGIRQGVMAADQFTQIANVLFHTTELSYKAKGLFGLLSTHREGWRMTVTDIARRGRDGESAVKSGLKELEKHGFSSGNASVARTEPSAQLRTSSPTCPPCKTAGRNQNRVFRQWMTLRWLIGPLRTPTERRPLSRTPDPSLPAPAQRDRAAKRRQHIGRHRLPRTSNQASACCWRSVHSTPSCC